MDMATTINTFVYSLATLATASAGYIYSRRTISNSRIPKRGGGGEDMEDAMMEKEMISSVTSQLEEKAAHTEPQEQDLEIKETGLQVECTPSLPPLARSQRSFLKRKSIDNHYPIVASASSPSDEVSPIPCKRTKTPTNNTDGGEDAKFEEDYLLVRLRAGNQEIEIIDLSVPASPPASDGADTDSEEDADGEKDDVLSPPGLGAPPVHEDLKTPSPSSRIDTANSSSPKIVESPPPIRALPCGFASFAGPTKAFQPLGGGGESAFQTASAFQTPSALEAPVFSPWRVVPLDSASSGSKVAFGDVSSPLASSFALSSTASSGKTVSASESSKATQPPTSVALTGEENEDVLSEIKGVRLYVKRGDKEFGSPGMLGTLRLLADREETSSERLLFRREPLWQASMNLRVNEGVRCAFDKEESVLRFTLKELIEGQKGDSEVVVYAFKPGKATSKQDFVSFGQRLVRDGKFMC